MKHVFTKSVIVSAAAVAAVGAGSLGVAHAASTTTTRRSIAGYTVRATRQQAVAEVLGTTPDALQTSLKTETMTDVLKSKNLSQADFRSKVKTQLSKDLAAKGYTSDQINRALSHQHKYHSKQR